MSETIIKDTTIQSSTKSAGLAETSIEKFRTEFVIGLVGPVGTDLKTFEHLTETELTKYGYTPKFIKLSEYLESSEGVKESGEKIDATTGFDRYWTLMNAGNNLRQVKGNGFLGKIAAAKILENRTSDKEGNRLPMTGKVHIVHSIKHKREVEILREVYGGGFFLVGLSASRDDRIRFLRQKGISEEDAIRLILRDRDENEKFGQQTSKVFELSDVFIEIPLDNQDVTRNEIDKFLRLLFGFPFATPTRDENGMFLSYAASLRSGSLARQIGAVVANASGDIVATGTNDVPQFGGGQYWAGDNDARDFQRGYDANTKVRNKLLETLVEKVADAENLLSIDEKEKIKEYTSEDKLALGKQIFKGTTLFDLTEFGRDVHAEMEALLACARIGVSVKGGTLFCTTFPCHNCAKHIVDAGIERVVYIEAYPKSKASELHSDSLSIEGKTQNKVIFEQFIGIGPRRYFDLFSMSLGTGSEKIRKDDDGDKIPWVERESLPRFKMKHISYLEREQRVADEILQTLKEASADGVDQ